jgi:hypothetical protein
VSRVATGTATYLYGLVQRKRSPLLGRAPRGLPGTGPLRALPAGGDLWLIVADAPLERYAAEPLERGLRDLNWVSACALAHEAVVERMAKTATTVPVKLFTLFASDARAIAHVAGLQPGLGGVIARIAGRQEWGVRVTLDETKARRTLAERARRASGAVTSGTKFLLLKKAEREAVRDALERGRTQVDGVFEALAGLAADARRRPPDTVEGGARLLLDAAFLVEPKQLTRFKTAARRAAARLSGDGYVLTLSGPWPAYNFVGGLE